MTAGTYNPYNTLLRVTESHIFGDAGSPPLLGIRGAPVPHAAVDARRILAKILAQVLGVLWDKGVSVNLLAHALGVSWTRVIGDVGSPIWGCCGTGEFQ